MPVTKPMPTTDQQYINKLEQNEKIQLAVN